MTAPAESMDQATLRQKRMELFSLWRDGGPGVEHQAAPAAAQAQMAGRAALQAPPDEVRELILRFANPEADRLFLRALY